MESLQRRVGCHVAKAFDEEVRVEHILADKPPGHVFDPLGGAILTPNMARVPRTRS